MSWPQHSAPDRARQRPTLTPFLDIPRAESWTLGPVDSHLTPDLKLSRSRSHLEDVSSICTLLEGTDGGELEIEETDRLL